MVQLLVSKCIQILMYGIEACPLIKSQLLSLDFAVNRFLMKLFRISSTEVVKQCQEYFAFEIPSVLWAKRVNKFENLKILTIFFIKNCCNLLAYTYCHVVMSCLHIVMSVYYLLVDYYVYFVYVCMFATTKWWIKMNIMGRGARFAESHTRCLGVLK